MKWARDRRHRISSRARSDAVVRVHAGVNIDRNFNPWGARRVLRTVLVRAVLFCALIAVAACSTSPRVRATNATVHPSPVTAVADTTPTQSASATVPESGQGVRLGDWTLQNRFFVPAPPADQGLATVTRDGKSEIVFRGGLSIPPRLRGQGWVHVGDPDSWHDYIVDSYQGSPSMGQKLYEVTPPEGEVLDFVHRLVPGEDYNNSFVTITPDGRWMVSGEWGDMTRLLVFPSPLVNSPVTTRVLDLSPSIHLDHRVRDLQGCVFTGPTQLLCSSADPGTDLWPTPDQLLQLTLVRPLDGSAVTADVRSLGELPMLSSCAGEYEPEGVDYHDGLLRVEVRSPGVCSPEITVYQYRRQD